MVPFVQVIELSSIEEKCKWVVRIDLVSDERVKLYPVEQDLDFIILEVLGNWRGILEYSRVFQNDISLVNLNF